MRFVIPEQVVTHFHIREGDTVGDFGAGSGYFEKALSEVVGAEGRVYAFEIQKQLVESLNEKARNEHLSNVEVVWCDIEASGGCKLTENTLDAGILVNTLFQVEKKDVCIEEVTRLIQRGGSLFVIDWTDSFGGMGPAPNAIFSEGDARTLLESKGWTFERTFPCGDHHYGLAFRKKT